MTYLPFARPTIDEETIAGVAEVLRSGWITTGPKVKAFEQALSDYLGGRLVRTFTSATGALEVALQACGIGPGDEVIVPAMTFAASANVVMRVGARPVFVDVELDTRNLDLDQARSGDHAAHPRDHAGALRRAGGGHGPALRDRPAARPARDRGRGARDRHALAGQAHRQLRRPGLVQLPSQQEHDHDRGRRARACPTSAS